MDASIAKALLEKADEISHLLKILANKNRLLICCTLVEQPLTVGEIVKKIPHMTQPVISQQLQVLKLNKILSSTKNGQYVTYSFYDNRILLLLEILKEKFCE